MGRKIQKIALIGNPNSGKSSLFNVLTGLSQKISNYPGVTVDKKSGKLKLSSGDHVEIIDFPGIYSLYPNSSDEKIVVETLTDPDNENYPDAILYVAGALELEKHFLLATQLKELQIPMLFCITMSDIGDRKGVKYNTDLLSQYLDLPVIEISAMEKTNIDALKYRLIELIHSSGVKKWQGSQILTSTEQQLVDTVNAVMPQSNDFRSLLIAHHHQWLNHLSSDQRSKISDSLDSIPYSSTRLQIEETLLRYNHFDPLIRKSIIKSNSDKTSWSARIDSLITHRIGGPLIFFLIMFFVFQAIYAWAETPMTWIEEIFSFLSTSARSSLPESWFTNLIVDGVVPGLGGVLIFIPQITILFLLLSILEEAGYMSRAVFMFDGMMQRVGLNGRSIVALISSGACAIPAIMSTRTISNWKERLITILVAPLISCSARLPVYAVLIGFVVPSKTVWGIFNSQGLAFMGIYLLGIAAALISAWVFKYIIKSDERSFLMIELPQYKRPLLSNVLLTVKEKVTSFIYGAGKIILLISIILWFLASYGPPQAIQEAKNEAMSIADQQGIEGDEREDLLAAYHLEASYAGHLGKFIEPVIRPLGYDWKIGIALITSFAAREVFVGTMATIYSVGSTDDELTIRQKMAAEINPLTGKPRYDMATSLSLLLFYVFAMQCMSTLAVTKRETKSWKWPFVQFSFMSVLAYLSSLLAYQLLS